jgi:hypothetical protein
VNSSANISPKLKRQHSAEPLNANSRKSPASVGTTSLGATPPPSELDPSVSANAIPIPPQTLPNNVFGSLPDDAVIGSPLKKHRSSLCDMDAETLQKRLGAGFTSTVGNGGILAAAEAAQNQIPKAPKIEMEEEL